MSFSFSKFLVGLTKVNSNLSTPLNALIESKGNEIMASVGSAESVHGVPRGKVLKSVSKTIANGHSVTNGVFVTESSGGYILGVELSRTQSTSSSSPATCEAELKITVDGAKVYTVGLNSLSGGESKKLIIDPNSLYCTQNSTDMTLPVTLNYPIRFNKNLQVEYSGNLNGFNGSTMTLKLDYILD